MHRQLQSIAALSALSLALVVGTATCVDARSGRGIFPGAGGAGFQQGGGFNGGWRGYGGRNYGYNGWRGRGYGYRGYGGYYGGWGYGAGGLLLGGLLGAALVAPGYGYGYGYPAYYGPEIQEAPPYNGHRCYWSSEPTYTNQGQIISKPVQICY